MLATREKVLGFITAVIHKSVNRQLKVNVSRGRRGREEHDLLSPAKAPLTFCKLRTGLLPRGSEAESESDSDCFPKGQESARAPFWVPLNPFLENVTT